MGVIFMEEKETKICKYCQSEIPKKAKICPNCRKKQSKFPKWVIFAVVILVLIIAIGSCGGGDDTKDTTDVSDSGNETKTEQTEEKKDENTDDKISVGQSFESNGLKITVNDASLDYQDYDNSYGLYTPEDGMKYIMVDLTYENTGKSDEYASIYDFECYADNTNCSQAYIGDNSFMNTNLSSGRNVSFKIYFSVPQDAQVIELEYAGNIWSNDKPTIKLQ